LISGELPAGWEAALPTYTPEDKPLATRLHSQTNLNALAGVLPGAHATVLPQCSSQEGAPCQSLSGSVLGQGNFYNGLQSIFFPNGGKFPRICQKFSLLGCSLPGGFFWAV
jgi:hypothetical protein